MTAATMRADDPIWLQTAFKDLGLHEIAGPRHAARVLAMFRTAGHTEVKDDETAWCSAAVNTWMIESGLAGTKQLNARSWLDYGTALNARRKLPRGAILIFRRGNSSWQGHVCLLLEDQGERLLVLGGNQRDMVCVMTMPQSSLIGARWPKVAGGAQGIMGDGSADVDAAEALTPETITDSGAIEAVQRRLRELNYFTGNPDGDSGELTKNAVMAFRRVNDLPLSSQIDAELVTRVLSSDAKPNPIAEERASATAEDISDINPAVKASLRQRAAAKWAMVCTFFGGLFRYVLEQFQALWDQIEPVRDFLYSVPSWLWIGGVLVVCLYFYSQSKSATDDMVNAYQKGHLQ